METIADASTRDTPAAPTTPRIAVTVIGAHLVMDYGSEERARAAMESGAWLDDLDAIEAEARSTPAEALREALEHVLDVWPAPSPEEFARLHRVLTGHESCSPHNREAGER